LVFLPVVIVPASAGVSRGHGGGRGPVGGISPLASGIQTRERERDRKRIANSI
jgi:hypothetical protein